jgi:hypothetical protein
MSLLRVALIVTFGRNSPHPLRLTIYKLSTILVLTTGLSWLFAQEVAGMPTIPLPQAVWLTFTAAFITQVVTLSALLSASGIIRLSSTDTFARQLLLLPITKSARWMALMLPSFIVTAVAMALITWPLASLLSKMGLHPLLIACGEGGGALSALGVIYGVPRRHAWAKIIGVPFLIGGEYILIRTINNNATVPSIRIISGVAIASAVIILSWLFFRSSLRISQEISYNARGTHVFGIFLPSQFWFAKSIIRAKNTLLGCLTTLGMSIGILVLLRRYGMAATTYTLVATILAAAFVSDFRSLAKRSNPAEITALRATAHFVSMHVATALAFGFAATLPLAASVFVTSPDLSSVTQHGAQLFFGISVGLFAGTLIVPAHRDVAGQLLASLLCVAVIMAASYAPLNTSGMILFEILLGCSLIGCAWIIEYQRNYYVWRKTT